MIHDHAWYNLYVRYEYLVMEGHTWYRRYVHHEMFSDSGLSTSVVLDS